MAVKQKVPECVASTEEARLQLILRALQRVTDTGLQEKMCPQIVKSLGSVHVPTDVKDYKQFIEDIKSVQDILTKECLRNDLIFVTLEALFHQISSPDSKHLSPAMSIVLQLIHVDGIPKAVELILNSRYSEQSLQRALLTLCNWLTKWTWTENLSPLILAFMQGLEAQQYYNILLEVMLATIQPLFKMLVVMEPRKSVGPIVTYVLMRLQHPEVFHKIIHDIKTVVNCLNKENSESSRQYLREVVNLSIRLMERFPQYLNLYEPIKKDLEPFFPAGDYKQAVNCLPWTNNTDFSPTNYFSSTIVGKVGLNNLGNTCYVNSVLQALFMTKPFRNEILLYNREMMQLFNKLQILFALLQHSPRPSLSPSEILNLARPPGFLPGHQHDSSEFLGYLLDILHEQEKTAAQQIEGAINTNCTVVQSTFGGRTRTISRCGECGTKSDRIDNFRELQLSFPNDTDDQSVQTLLDYYVQPEKLSGDNQYHCDICDCLTDGERITCIEEAPPHLILTLKHFRYDPASQQRTKLLQSVKLDSHVQLEGTEFELYAAVVHCGSSVDSGHYYTFGKDGDDWFKFNDCSVMKTTAEELCSLKPPETPYILFYSRQDNSGGDSGDLPFTALPARLRLAVTKDNSDFDADRKRKIVTTYNTRQNRNDEPPPPGCGDGGFSSNSSNMYVC